MSWVLLSLCSAVFLGFYQEKNFRPKAACIAALLLGVALIQATS